MRIYALIAAFVLVSGTAYAEPRSLSLNGVDQKLPGSLGKAAETPKVVEAAPAPLDPPRPPAPPPAAAAPAVAVPAAPAAVPATAAPAPAVEAPKAETPAYVPRPSVAGNKPAGNKEGEVTFDDGKQPAEPAATTTTEKPKQAKADKPRRKRQHWDEARIMREISRYSGYAGMLGGW